MRFLFLLFIIIPLIEITVLINVGQLIGAWYTVGLVLLSAFIGVNMLRHQGLSTLMRARSRMDSGEIPAQEMIEGLILAVGGALLVTPGFVTDVVGFCCLIPVTRHALVTQLKKHFTLVAMQRGGAYQPGPGAGPHRGGSGQRGPGGPEEEVRVSPGPAHPRRDRGPKPRHGEVIEGEFRREDDPE